MAEMNKEVESLNSHMLILNQVMEETKINQFNEINNLQSEFEAL